MNPTLPGSLIEREKICDLCDCYTCNWVEIEMRGGMYTLCADCQLDKAYEVAEARAKADADGAAEDAAQEGE